jgi:DNA/RNA-binding domain of Phe-tRNA-synthetase-like protein
VKPEFEIRVELEGWLLYTAVVEVQPHDQAGLDRAVAESEQALREAFKDRLLSADPVVKAVRKQFKRLGTDPTRYRPSFEAMGRRLLKGNPVPRILPMVDVINLLSIRLKVPVCVVDVDKVTPPLTLKAGQPGDSFVSLKGEFNAAAKPTLWDARGIVGTPIVDSEHAKITETTKQALLYVYVPQVAGPETVPAGRVLKELLEQTQAGRIVSEKWVGRT